MSDTRVLAGTLHSMGFLRTGHPRSEQRRLNDQR